MLVLADFRFCKRNSAICTYSSGINTHANRIENREKALLCPLTGENRADRVDGDEVSAAPGVHAYSQPRNMDRTPSAETHDWFQQGKGTFTGALCTAGLQSSLPSAWEPEPPGLALSQ